MALRGWTIGDSTPMRKGTLPAWAFILLVVGLPVAFFALIEDAPPLEMIVAAWGILLLYALWKVVVVLREIRDRLPPR